MLNTTNTLTDRLIPVFMAANVWIGDQQIQEILSLEIIQNYGSHHVLALRFYQDQVQPTGSMIFQGAEQLLGKIAEVKLYDRNAPGEAAQLKQLFVVTKVSLDQNAMNEGVVALEGMAPTWLLDGADHFESFYRQTLPEIVRTVCKPLEQVKSKVTIDSTWTQPLNFVCRYRESAWNFLQRISRETGQWLYFDGQSLIFGKAKAEKVRDLIYGGNCYQIALSLQVAPVQSGYFDYNTTENNDLSASADHDAEMEDSDQALAFDKAKSLFVEDAFAYPKVLNADADILTQMGKSKAQATASELYIISGESTLQELNPGMVSDLKMVRAGTKINHTPLRIISVHHTLDATGHYHNTFKAISAQSKVPPATPLKYPVASALPAEVIDNADPLEQGRVQVRFLGWNQKHSVQQTGWIRVLTPDGGSSSSVQKNRGYVFVPETGDQVMVAFEQNNPDRPYVQGSLYHGKNGQGGGAQNNVKSIKTRSGHMIEFSDEAEGTHIIIKDPGGNEIYLDTQGKSITISAPETITLSAKNIMLNAAQSINATAGTNISQSAGATMTNVAGINIQNTAAADFTMMAANIIGTADDSVQHNAAKSIQKRGSSIEASATESDFKLYSAQKIVNTSGEKGKLF